MDFKLILNKPVKLTISENQGKAFFYSGLIKSETDDFITFFDTYVNKEFIFSKKTIVKIEIVEGEA